MTAHTHFNVTELSVAYGSRAVIDRLSLPPLASGEVTAIIGPNGAGKSTLVKALAQIVPSTGTLRLGEDDIRKLSRRERSRLSGFMPQSLPQGAELTPVESIVVSLKAAAVSRQPEREALELLERLEILDLALRPLDRLSGGERQLVSLAQAVACNPKLLFLDEPTSALDLARQFQVMRHVRAIARAGAAVIIVLHDLALAAQWADRIVVLKAGRLHSSGSSAEVLKPAMLAEVYGLAARIEISGEQLFVVPEGIAGQPSKKN